MNLKTIIIRVSPILHKNARRKSVDTGKSLNKVLTEKLQEWVKSEEKDPQPAKQK